MGSPFVCRASSYLLGNFSAPFQAKTGGLVFLSGFQDDVCETKIRIGTMLQLGNQILSAFGSQSVQ